MQVGSHWPAALAVWPLQLGFDSAHRDAGGPSWTDGGDPPAGRTGGGRGSDHLSGLYAHDFDVRAAVQAGEDWGLQNMKRSGIITTQMRL